MKSDYLQFFLDRGHTKFVEETLVALKGKGKELDELPFEIKSTKDSLEITQMALLEAENQPGVAKQFREQENEGRPNEIKQVIYELDMLKEDFDLEQFLEFASTK